MTREVRQGGRPPPRIGFVLIPRFTLTAFAGFVDALRLAADEGDLSRPMLCRWDILGPAGSVVTSSCGATVQATAPLADAGRYDLVVVVAGLLHGGQNVPGAVDRFLHDAADARCALAGLCTGSFVLARAGLLDGYLTCVSWFHREEFEGAFPDHRVVSNQMFVVDRDRMTCAGGTSVVHLAAWLIERWIDRPSAMKALRILIEEQPLPARTLQPEPSITGRSRDPVVRRAMLELERTLQSNASIDDLARTLGLSRRQLERRFAADTGVSPSAWRQSLRLDRGTWLLQNTDMDVLSIALECGFGDGDTLTRALRRTSGVSASGLRRRSRGR